MPGAVKIPLIMAISIRSVWENVLANLIATTLTALGGVMLALLYILAPNWFSTILWGMVGSGLTAVICLVFIIISRLPKKPIEITTENVEANIRSWLDSFHLSVKKAEESEHIFTLLVTLDNDSRLIIGRPKQLDRYIILQSSIVISPEDQATLNALSEEDRAVFWGRLGIEASKLFVQYVIDLPRNIIALTSRIAITADLNESTFMEAVDKIDNAKLATLKIAVLMLRDEKAKLLSSKSNSDLRLTGAKKPQRK